MVDIHCHILPGIDDGARTWDEALDMAVQAVGQGIRTLIATPHFIKTKYDNPAPIVLEAVATLNEKLHQRDIPLEVLAGHEVHLDRYLLDALHDRSLLQLADSRFMLVELPPSWSTDDMEDLIHEMHVLHITPIIAHPERNQEVANAIDKLSWLIDMGALCQITSHSIVGLFGKKAQQLSMRLCKKNLAHFIASDAHNAHRRSCSLQSAYEYLAKALGTDYVAYYQKNAQDLIDRRMIDPWPVEKERRWAWFR